VILRPEVQLHTFTVRRAAPKREPGCEDFLYVVNRVNTGERISCVFRMTLPERSTTQLDHQLGNRVDKESDLTRILPPTAICQSTKTNTHNANTLT
jgi:hypothetical protein